MTVEGIDISHHQADTPPLANLDFVFVRATYGTVPDGRWGMHAANVRASGAVLGAFHFGRSVQDPIAQADAFLNVIGPVRLVALDVELDTHPKRPDGTPVPPDPPMTHQQAAQWIAHVKATGRTVLLYHSDSGFFDAGQDANWVANWSNKPTRPYAIWQYGSRDTGPMTVDGDRFAGTIAELRALAGLGPTSLGALMEEPMGLYVPTLVSGHFDLPAGVTVRAWKATDTGWVVEKTWSGHGASTAHYDYKVKGPNTPSNLVHCVAGTGSFFDDLYVATSEIVEVDDAPVAAVPK